MKDAAPHTSSRPSSSSPKGVPQKKSFFQRWGFLIFSATLCLLCWAMDVQKTERALALAGGGIVEMLGFLPPIFVLLGLFDVWVDRETVMRLMGQESGFKGAILAFLLGTLAAGPLYMAFPVAGVLLKKRAGLFPIFVFTGTWAIAKVPMLLFETSCFGFAYTALRFVCNMAAIAGIAWFMTRTLGPDYAERLYREADSRA
ncbi:permease [Mailhella sp.]|uniref:permease n=1 Tax=Mailhella sp. TaxID=1981029 RepID=UPI004062ED12